jgi:hypothetical protein
MKQRSKTICNVLKFSPSVQSGKPYSNFKNAVRRLEDVALHARGEERQQAVARWLGALRDLQRVAETGGGIKDLHREPSGEGEIPESPGTPKSEIEEGVHRANLVSSLTYKRDVTCPYRAYQTCCTRIDCFTC